VAWFRKSGQCDGESEKERNNEAGRHSETSQHEQAAVGQVYSPKLSVLWGDSFRTRYSITRFSDRLGNAQIRTPREPAPGAARIEAEIFNGQRVPGLLMIVVAFTHDLCTVPYAERFVRTIKERLFGANHFLWRGPL